MSEQTPTEPTSKSLDERLDEAVEWFEGYWAIVLAAQDIANIRIKNVHHGEGIQAAMTGILDYLYGCTDEGIRILKDCKAGSTQ